jgi:hypothetical protein
MKTIVKSTLSILLGVIITGSVAVAQDQSQTKTPVPTKNMKAQILTENQKAMQKAGQQKRKEMREAFKTTISQDQKDLLSDPRLVKADRIKKFRASLTDKQVSMIKARQQEVKAEKEQFRATLTDQQKIQLRQRSMMKGNMTRGNQMRGRMNGQVSNQSRMRQQF